MHHPFGVSENIYFRAIEKEDFTERLCKWRNDPEVTRLLFQGILPTTKEVVEEEYEQLVRSKNDVVFSIVDKQTDTQIGFVGLYQINWIAKSGEMRIFIGEKEAWNKGYGTEATKMIVSYGFERLNLNRIWAGSNIENIGSWKSEEKAGFRKEGILRQEMYCNGKYFDVVRSGILRDEYLQSRKGDEL